MKVKYRVKSHEDFQEVIKEKKTVSNRIYILYYKKNELKHSRLGISASKKLGNAVTRNKIRRQIRMMAQQVINFENSIDYCLIVRKQYLEESYENNKKEFSILIEKANRRIKNEI
jgi:ribonuclease P protein component